MSNMPLPRIRRGGVVGGAGGGLDEMAYSAGCSFLK